MVVKAGLKRPAMKIAMKTLKVYLIAAGVAANLFLIWMAAGWPIFFDRWLNISAPPAAAAFIICPTGGLSGSNLPTDVGWHRIYTAVQLYLDGFGKKIIFTGGGVGKVTESEIYAEAAGWLGCPDEARVFQPGATSTAEHPTRLLHIEGLGITRETVLNIVTSDIHSRRLALCFKKAGFKNFRVVTSYVARKAGPYLARELRVSRFVAHRPSGKRYDDVFNRLRWRSSYFFEALREVAAISVYKLKGAI
jgi:uncharacterized SAM-binding protein YcdF (DUF218 family)